MGNYLDFERPIEDLELKIEELRRLSDGTDIDISSELRKLDRKAGELRAEIFSGLTRWQRTQLARHPDRPYTLDYIGLIVKDFIELHGDRRFADDFSIVGGLGRIGDTSVMVIGHQKGRGVKQRIERNFGQPNPEGYRKAMRLMKIAERFRKPVITFIDTPGAYPGIGAEQRGQAEAIATNLMEMSRLRVPIIAVVIGEGGSGGALALGVGDRLFMLEHSVYSVISPEGCASILWKKAGGLTQEDFARAADALRVTAQDLMDFKLANAIIPEPMGGAHRDPAETAHSIETAVLAALGELAGKTPGKLLDERYRRIRRMGEYVDEQKAAAASPELQ